MMKIKFVVIFTFSILSSKSGFCQSTPHYYKATKASFKRESDTSFSVPLFCDDILLVNNDNQEITLVSGTFAVYKITSAGFIDENNLRCIKMDALDRNNNKFIFKIYTYLNKETHVMENMILIIDDKNNFGTILYATEQKVD